MNYMLLPLKRYADFSGRSSRMEFWMFVLFQLIVSWGISFVVNMIFPPAIPVYDPANPEAAMAAMGSIYSSPGFIVSCLVGLFFLIPGLAVSVRRLHDQDKTGWLLLLAFIPLIGAIILLVFYVLPGTVGDNRYGPDPTQSDI
ncbi:DUF805 domain-containing protein [Sphingomonas sp. LB-2]|uniref:DUF805 domain-containing protein n=1 Tax=Sphingomonas caeni TaxID=2984949 RepID=UPI00223045F1|nr:DUF805 domain-containing protein [Sphingomonas caeni]MCW3849406.1 DUF805 domain-containing protein [Sphingomonas caeni]